MAESYMHPEDIQRQCDVYLPNYPEWNRPVYVEGILVNTLDAFVSEPIIDSAAYGASAEAIKAWKYKLERFHNCDKPAARNVAASDTSNTADDGTANAQRKRPLTSMR